MAVISSAVLNLWNTNPQLQVINPLGGGSFGNVWKAKHKTDGHHYAVKVVSVTKTFIELKSLNKLMREVQILATFQSDFVIRYYNSWLENVQPPYQVENVETPDLDDWSSTSKIESQLLFIQTELCDGDLYSLITSPEGKTISTDHLKEMCIQMASGVCAIHEKGIIHRDLKPENIFYVKALDKSLKWKIGDFGLGIDLDANEANKSTRGTRPYRSPEMIRVQSDYTFKTDVYSLGIVFWEIILQPLNKKDSYKLFYSAQDNMQNFDIVMNSMNKPYCVELTEIIAKMLNHDVESRPSADQVVALLKTSLEDCGVAAGSSQMKRSNESSNSRKGKRTNKDMDIDDIPAKQRILETIGNFVGREEELNQLENWFSNHLTKLVLICGLGGVGKTELVRQFVKTISTTEFAYSWLNGDSLQSFTNSVMKIAKKLEMPKEIQTLAEASYFLYEEFPNKFPGYRWLIVVDNVDNAEDQILKTIHLFRKLNPAFVIVTSRLRNLFGDEANLLEIDELETEDAKALVSTSLGLKQEDPQVQLLCQKLQNYPLALQQAISFIIQQRRHSIKGKNYGIQNYLKVFEKQEESTLGFESLRISDQYDKTTLVTWNITVDKIKSNHGAIGVSAFEILNMLSFMNPDAIPLYFITNLFANLNLNETGLNNLEVDNAEMLSNSSDGDSDSEISIVEECVCLLKNYSMLKVENEEISVHRLVQKVTKLRLQNHQELLTKLIKSMTQLEIRRPEIFHIISVWEHGAKYTTIIQDFPYFAYKTSMSRVPELRNEIEMIQRNLIGSERCELYEKILPRIKQVLGEEHDVTLKIQFQIAKNAQPYSKSLEMLENICEKRLRIDGAEGKSTLKSKQEIAKTLDSLERSDDAIKMLEEIRQIAEKRFGGTHKLTLEISQSMTRIYLYMPNPSKALEMYRRIETNRREFFGQNDYLALNATRNIFSILFNDGKYEECKGILEALLDVRIRLFGEEDYVTLYAKERLAMTLKLLGIEEQRALQLYRELLAAKEKEGEVSTLTYRVKRFIAELEEKLQITHTE